MTKTITTIQIKMALKQPNFLKNNDQNGINELKSFLMKIFGVRIDEVRKIPPASFLAVGMTAQLEGYRENSIEPKEVTEIQIV